MLNYQRVNGSFPWWYHRKRTFCRPQSAEVTAAVKNDPAAFQWASQDSENWAASMFGEFWGTDGTEVNKNIVSTQDNPTIPDVYEIRRWNGMIWNDPQPCRIQLCGGKSPDSQRIPRNKCQSLTIEIILIILFPEYNLWFIDSLSSRLASKWPISARSCALIAICGCRWGNETHQIVITYLKIGHCHCYYCYYCYLPPISLGCN